MQAERDLGGFSFEGPWIDKSTIPSWTGVYVVMDSIPFARVLSVGQAQDIHQRLSDHDYASRLTQAAQDVPNYWLHRMQGSTEQLRMDVEQRVRQALDPLLGEQ